MPSSYAPRVWRSQDWPRDQDEDQHKGRGCSFSCPERFGSFWGWRTCKAKRQPFSHPSGMVRSQVLMKGSTHSISSHEEFPQPPSQPDSSPQRGLWQSREAARSCQLLREGESERQSWRQGRLRTPSDPCSWGTHGGLSIRESCSPFELDLVRTNPPEGSWTFSQLLKQDASAAHNTIPH